jgi:hypothetical protein
MMCMMGCFAVVRMNPVGLILTPGNIAVAVALLLAAPLIGLRKPFAFAVGLGAAGLTVLVGALGAAKVRGIEMPGSPLMWIVIGLYIAFRLTLIQQSFRREELAARKATSQRDLENADRDQDEPR